MRSSDQPIIYKPLKRRFYILFSFCIYSFTCGIIWNSWAPLIKSINELYHWTNTEVNLLNNINAFIVCVFIFPFIVLWNKLGIKFSYNISCCIILLGCLIRVFPSSYSVQAILIQVGNAISSFGNLMSYVGSTAISSIWFPTNERSRSTCTALAFSTLGSVMSPIISSNIVPAFSEKVVNSTDEKEKIHLGMQQFMFFHCSIALTSLILIIIYFPSKPKYMPCKSSEKSLRIDLKSGCFLLLKNKQFWIVFLLNFITSGINSGVVSVLPSIIEPLGISQKETALMIALGNLSVFISSLIGGWLGDKFSYKKIVILSIPPTIVTYIVFGLQSMKILRHDLGSVYAVLLVMLFMSNIISNISFEMGCEVSFPASEEVTTAVLGFATNFGIVIILTVTMITDKKVTWIPYSYAGAVLFVLPFMIFYKDERKRFNCDFVVPPNSILEVNEDIEAENLQEEIENEELEDTYNELEDCSLLRLPS